jgi:uncharacterized protein (TIGR04255 family)
MDLPKRIHPNPIIDVSAEIRFTTEIHPTAVFGIIYKELKNEFPKVENLPILQIPEHLRSIDPNFKFKPHYKIFNDSIVIQIGPDVISISSFPRYSGWIMFSETIFHLLNKLNRTNIINEVLRLGIRYINFFETDIFNKLKIAVSLDGQIIEYRNTVFRSEFVNGLFSTTLQVANNVTHSDKLGSVIDIDSALSSDLENFFDRMKIHIHEGHRVEKDLFFSLLKADFLETLHPEY